MVRLGILHCLIPLSEAEIIYLCTARAHQRGRDGSMIDKKKEMTVSNKFIGYKHKLKDRD